MNEVVPLNISNLQYYRIWLKAPSTQYKMFTWDVLYRSQMKTSEIRTELHVFTSTVKMHNTVVYKTVLRDFDKSQTKLNDNLS